MNKRHWFRAKARGAAKDAIEATESEDRAAKLAVDTVRRGRFFGFEGGSAQEEIFSPGEAELSETSAAAAPIAEPAGEGDKAEP